MKDIIVREHTNLESFGDAFLELLQEMREACGKGPRTIEVIFENIEEEEWEITCNI